MVTALAASPTATALPTVLDIEASGFGRDSYPIEIGYVLPDGSGYCTLVHPEAAWTHWDPQAQRLHGITRVAVLKFAAEAQMEVEERPFTIAEAQSADEAFSTAASIFVMPVVEIDGTSIGTGKPGPIAIRLREIYLDEMRKSAI